MLSTVFWDEYTVHLLRLKVNVSYALIIKSQTKPIIMLLFSLQKSENDTFLNSYLTHALEICSVNLNLRVQSYTGTSG